MNSAADKTMITTDSYVTAGKGEDFDFGRVLECLDGDEYLIAWAGSETRTPANGSELTEITRSEYVALRDAR